MPLVNQIINHLTFLQINGVSDNEDEEGDTKYDENTKDGKDLELAAKVERVLKMFNASDLDNIIKVIPIKSMRKIKSKTRGNSN